MSGDYMDTLHFLLDSETATAGIQRGIVTSVSGENVEVFVYEVGTFACDMLQASDRAPTIERGDVVLMWHSGRDIDRGVVLGRVGASPTPATTSSDLDVREERAGSDTSIQDELVIEANKSLTLRVGAGSITIREDGKILIKGSDLVSHARRTNRIRGGAVSIN
jgi:hypothetical protein